MGNKAVLLSTAICLLTILPIEAEKLLFRDQHGWNIRDEPENPVTCPFQDPTLPWNQRVDDLVSRLSVEEIVPQTKAVYGGQTPAIPRLNIKPYIWISDCLHGQTYTNGTAFPMAIGLAATFR